MIVMYVVDKDDLNVMDKHDVLDMLYMLKIKIPTVEQIHDYMGRNKTNQIANYFKHPSSYPDKIQQIKNEISKIEDKIPLYDVYRENLYIISKENVYDRITYQAYRFPDHSVIEALKDNQRTMQTSLKKHEEQYTRLNTLKQTTKLSSIQIKEYSNIVVYFRKLRKLNLMLEYIDSFNLDLLEQTYFKILYHYGYGKDIIFCKKKSFSPFLKHIKPYYTQMELICMAKNMGSSKLVSIANQISSKKSVTSKDILRLCKKVSENDISYKILLQHQIHITKEDLVGLIQYYTIHGSYFMNQYLRQLTKYTSQNRFLESVIRSMVKLIRSAPGFDKHYTLYRFISNDDHIKHLNIGDTFVEKGFMSTTRNPFYNIQNHYFGFILMKIKIPANKRGIGLCIETLSEFKNEEEIILAPMTKLKLITKDQNVAYHNPNRSIALKVKTRYEFEWVGTESDLHWRQSSEDDLKTVDFLKLKQIQSLSVDEKIYFFVKHYCNEMNQFHTYLGDHKVVVLCEWYDSTSVYKNFYAVSKNNGFSMYTFYDNYMMFFIEIGQTNLVPYMYVNYFFKFSSTKRSEIIDDTLFIEFLSKIAVYFDVHRVIIYSDYSSCRISAKEIERINDRDFMLEQLKIGGNYSLDLYNYLKHDIRRFAGVNQIRPVFSYDHLNRLKTTSVSKILSKEDRDELYQIYWKVFLEVENKKEFDNIAYFYVWVIDNYCYLTSELVHKMHKLFPADTNPFLNDFYELFPHGTESATTSEEQHPKNLYRIQNVDGTRLK